MPPVEVEAGDAVRVGQDAAGSTARDPDLGLSRGAGWAPYRGEQFLATVVRQGKRLRDVYERGWPQRRW